MIRPRTFAAAVVAATLATSSTTHAFTPSTTSSSRLQKSLLQVTTLPTATGFYGSSFEDENQQHEEHVQPALSHAHAPIVAINSPQELADFLHQDDRICIIKFHAAWCKSCQRFGHKFQGLANQKTDCVDSDGSVVQQGPMRFGSIEFGANTPLCRALKIKRLPTVHFYQKGQQLEGFPCGPSKFPILLEKVDQYLQAAESASFEEIMGQGDQLMSSAEVTGVLTEMIAQEANGELESSTSSKTGKKSWFRNIMP